MRPFQVVRHVRLFMRVDPGPARGPADFRRTAVGVVWLVRFFYLFIAFKMNTSMRPFEVLANGTPTDPLWPIELLNALMGTGWVEQAYGMPFTPVACSILGLLAIIFPGMLIWRLGVFFYLFVFIALTNSYGSTNHGAYFFVYISFALLFLPSAAGHPGRMSRKNAMDCIMVFWFAQSVVLLPYFLAGFWKIVGSGLELLTPDGFVRILLARAMTDMHPVPLMLPFVVEHQWLSQIAFLSVVYVQVVAGFALFRPHLHRPFGVVLILFHFGTDWLMNIKSYDLAVILGMIMVFSPLAPERFSWFKMAQSLPLLGIPFRLWAVPTEPLPRMEKERGWLVYDGECPVCKRYALYLDVKKAVGDLVLVNARQGGSLVEEVRMLSHDLNDGMVLKVGGRYYFGSEALHILALLSGRRGVFSLMNRILFGTRGAARMAYPLLRLGRRTLLKLRRIPPIE